MQSTSKQLKTSLLVSAYNDCSDFSLQIQQNLQNQRSQPRPQINVAHALRAWTA